MAESPGSLLGAKGAGLAALGQLARIPDYVVLTTEWTSRGVGRGKGLKAAATEEEWAEVLSAVQSLVDSAPHDIMVRPSIPDEPLDARGSTQTQSCDRDVATVLATVERVFQAHSSLPEVAVVIQLRVQGQPGHLSNEHRLAQDPNQWWIEFQRSRFDESSEARAIALWANRPMVAGRKGAPAVLDGELHRLAQSRTSDSSRWHFEWVFDGTTMWVVQADEELPTPKSLEPGAGWVHRLLRPLPSLNFPFRLNDDDDGKHYCKLEAQARFAAAGAPTTELVVLDDPGTMGELIKGQISKSVREGLVTLLDGGALVARTDVSSKSVVKGLPRSDCLLTIADFERFVSEKLGSDKRLSTGEAPVLILHRFIPASGSAFAYARGPAKDVQIDATFGLPDGLGIYPHDTFHVAPDGTVRVTKRYKSHFLDISDDGQWDPRRADPELGWRRSLSDAQAEEIARITRRLAELAGQPLVVMFFTGGAAEVMPLGVLPWIIDTEVPPEPTPGLYPEVSRGLHGIPIVRDVSELEAVPTGTRALYQPRLEHMRSDHHLTTMSHAAAARNVTLVWEGSVLAHAWYHLNAGGAVVIPLALEEDGSEEPGVLEFNKLVRDGIPTKILRGGERPLTASVSGPMLLRLLQQKLVEEAIEVLGARSRDELREELADLLEVVEEVLRQSHLSQAEVTDERLQKRQKRGGFEKGLVLQQTFPKDSTDLLRLEDAGHTALHPSQLQDLTDARTEVVGSDSIVVPRIPSHRLIDEPPTSRRLVVRGIVIELSEDLKSVTLRVRGPEKDALGDRGTDQLRLLT